MLHSHTGQSTPHQLSKRMNDHLNSADFSTPPHWTDVSLPSIRFPCFSCCERRASLLGFPRRKSPVSPATRKTCLFSPQKHGHSCLHSRGPAADAGPWRASPGRLAWPRFAETIWTTRDFHLQGDLRVALVLMVRL